MNKKNRYFGGAMFTIFLLLLLAPIPGQAGDSHHHGKSGVPKLELNKGKKWEADANSRAEMENIRKIFSAGWPAIREGKFTKEQYGQLAGEISGAVNRVFAHCKLDPKADSVLHSILAKVIRGSRAMNERAEEKARRQGASEIAEALAQYPLYFNHPGWPGL